MIDSKKTSDSVKDLPLVSMVIPCYNHAAYVQQSIASIITQDYANIELIIIDDGSSDESVQCIEAMLVACQQRFVRFEFRIHGNKGLSATLNEALEWANGEYFAALASDDILLPFKTSILIDAIESERGIAGVFCGAETINEHAGLLAIKCVPSKIYCGFPQLFLHNNSLIASSMLLDMASVRSVGGYDERVFFEDWYMWLKLTENGVNLMVLPDILVKYRIHPENMSKNIAKMQEARIKIAEMYSQHRLYPRVMANIYAASALEYSEVSLADTFRCLIKSTSFSLKVIFSHSFKYALAKALLPKKLLNAIKKLIA